MMNYKNITVAGSGVLGSQIVFQTAMGIIDWLLCDLEGIALFYSLFQ